ncbi:MAG: hypothetical protein EBX41_10185, partial [Chitinophagia bacterium]|nr:hypothetical protein [Chitinophagia bacterium]
YIYGIALQTDGKIVVAGYSYNGSNNDFALARYNTDGSLDTTFGSAGKVVTDFGSAADQVNGIALQKDGKIIVAGYATSAGANDFALARYTTDIDPLTQSASLFADGRGGLVS